VSKSEERGGMDDAYFRSIVNAIRTQKKKRDDLGSRHEGKKERTSHDFPPEEAPKKGGERKT